jgi:methylenetetrahydrofolate reductase (NADPH)
MPTTRAVPAGGDVRFEILPFGRGEEEAASLPEPVRLTVTCSPKHGPERSVQLAARLHELGHAVTVHVAARMVTDRAHVDSLLSGMQAAGVDDVFLIGGDADPPLGAYTSAVQLLPVIAAHPDRPRTIGIAGYPEGHPQIDTATLNSALLEKGRLADYVTTQLCFDADVLTGWIAAQRAAGLTVPVVIGMPGVVSPARLLEMSARIGVGPSMAFVRKQRGLRSLLGLFRKSASDHLQDALAGRVGDPELGIAGFHYFTFNQLLATYEWEHARAARGDAVRRPAPRNAAAGYGRPKESKT